MNGFGHDRFLKLGTVLVLGFSLVAWGEAPQKGNGGSGRSGSGGSNSNREQSPQKPPQNPGSSSNNNSGRDSAGRDSNREASDRAEAAKRAAEAQQAARERGAQMQEAQRKAAEQRAEIAKQAEASRRANEQRENDQRQAQARAAEQARQAEASRRANEQRENDQRQAQARAAEQARQAEASRRANEQRENDQRNRTRVTEQNEAAKRAEAQQAARERGAQMQEAQRKAAEQRAELSRQAEARKANGQMENEQRQARLAELAKQAEARKENELRNTQDRLAELARQAEAKKAAEAKTNETREPQRNNPNRPGEQNRQPERKKEDEPKRVERKPEQREQTAETTIPSKPNFREALEARKARIEKAKVDTRPLPMPESRLPEQKAREIVRPQNPNPQRPIAGLRERPRSNNPIGEARSVARLPEQASRRLGVQQGRNIERYEPKRFRAIAKPDQRPFERENIWRAYSNSQRAFQNRSIVNRVHEVKSLFNQKHGQRFKSNEERYQKYHRSSYYRDYYSRHRACGFFGGDYYPMRYKQNMSEYFAYPVIHWMYVQSPEPEYYREYYGANCKVEPFRYANDYYPTESLAEMGIDISGQSLEQQTNFREGFTNVTATLEKLISQRIGIEFEFADGQIVVTYYENLRDLAVVIEGFVDQDELHLPFKALIDLSDSSLSAIYAPLTDDPSTDDLTVLNWINERITQLGGDPLEARVYEDDEFSLE